VPPLLVARSAETGPVLRGRLTEAARRALTDHHGTGREGRNPLISRTHRSGLITLTRGPPARRSRAAKASDYDRVQHGDDGVLANGVVAHLLERGVLDGVHVLDIGAGRYALRIALPRRQSPSHRRLQPVAHPRPSQHRTS
jgi:hypothetical protein